MMRMMKVAQDNMILGSDLNSSCSAMTSTNSNGLQCSSSSSTSLSTSNSKSSKYSNDTFDVLPNSSSSHSNVSNGCWLDILNSCSNSLEDLGKNLSSFKCSCNNKANTENLIFSYKQHSQELRSLNDYVIDLQSQLSGATQNYRLSKKEYRELEVQCELQTKKLSELYKKLEYFDDMKEMLESKTHLLELKEAECDKLKDNQKSMDGEMQELSASLFEEAHKMVNIANVKQANAEKALKESKLQIDVLQAEVKALKDMVLTSTPSQPNKHLHPQLEEKSLPHRKGNYEKSKSTSLPRIQYGRENVIVNNATTHHKRAQSENFEVDKGEFDPVLHSEFSKWRQQPNLEETTEFMSRLYHEDIKPALNFPNQELSGRLMQAIESDSVFIERKNSVLLLKNCSLLLVPRLVAYNLRLDATDNSYHISSLCRNRITAVINLLNFLKYIKLGIVKVSDEKTFWDVMRLRKEVHVARFGLSESH